MVRIAPIWLGQNSPFGQTVSQTIASLRARAAAAMAKAKEKINRGQMISAEIKKLRIARKTAILEQKALFAERLQARIEQASMEAKEAADAAQVETDPVVVEQLAKTAEMKAAEAENALQVLLVEAGNPEQTAAATSPLNQPAPGEGGFPVVPVVIGAAAIVGLIALFTAKK